MATAVDDPLIGLVPADAPGSSGIAPRPAPGMASPLVLRGLLIGGSLLLPLLAARIAARSALPAPYLLADPGLARLLRGMAVIKAVVTLAAVAVLYWRFARPLPGRLAAAWLAGAWTLAAASALIWELRAIAPAALAFHAAGIAMLVLAWRDDRAVAR